eukprot:CAMPEP_0114628508 /NCGR_PEP_ID=MMETSP0168-20121206/12857_1 /TAXON_ID=95228 ORGANISM="Vannella sp., Strain DIVA3 517/6/12" /NCGR_SAMPLE_ID=MMETSP0168 /ASSEMBLY_ACC=CAM_ASM_000044 /LENGTH=736 /DNA_ID=CAMNT_0001839893 /DNA_START=21 /DNA_END=2227 /DNA_ORIENTATION=-
MTIGSVRTLKPQPGNRQPPPTPSKRDRQFREHFSSLGEPFLDHFACSFQREGGTVQHQGRMFITPSHICFHATHPGGDFVTSLPFAGVTSIVKKNTVFLFPNAIWVSHASGTDIYTGFFQRDKAFDLLHDLWQNASNDKEARKTLIKQEPKASKPMPASQDSTGDVSAAAASGATLSMRSFKTSEAVPVARSSLDDSDIAMDAPKISPTDMVQLRKRRRSMSAVNSDAALKKGSPAPQAPDPATKTLRFSLDDTSKGASVPDMAQKPAASVNAGHAGAPAAASGGAAGSGAVLKEAEEGGETAVDKAEEAEEEEEEKVKLPPPGPCSHAVYSGTGVRGALVVEESFDVGFEELYAKCMLDGTIYGKVMEAGGSWDMVVPEWDMEDAACHYRRLVTFVAPIKGAPIGPKQTKVEQTQVMSLMDEHTVALSSSTFSLDIPYSDAFLVEATMLAKADGKGASKLEVYVYVNFKKSPWVKSIIEKKAKDDTQTFFVNFAAEVRSALVRDKSKAKGGRKKAAADEGSKPKRRRRRRASAPAVRQTQETPATGWSTVTVPMLDVEVPVKETLLLLLLLGLAGMLFLTWLDVRALHAAASAWEDEYARQEDRVVFMQLVACQLAHNVSGGADGALSKEWKHWQKAKGAEWRLAEWKERLAATLRQLADAVQTSETVANQAKERLGADLSHLASEQEIRRWLDGPDDDSLRLDRSSLEGFSWLRLLGLTGSLLLLAVGLLLACT